MKRNEPLQLDCVAMKHSIQQKLMRKYAGLSFAQIRERMAKELAEGDDELSRLWRRLGESQNAPAAAGKPNSHSPSNLKTAKRKKSSNRRKPAENSKRAG